MSIQTNLKMDQQKDIANCYHAPSKVHQIRVFLSLAVIENQSKNNIYTK